MIGLVMGWLEVWSSEKKQRPSPWCHYVGIGSCALSMPHAILPGSQSQMGFLYQDSRGAPKIRLVETALRFRDRDLSQM